MDHMETKLLPSTSDPAGFLQPDIDFWSDYIFSPEDSGFFDFADRVNRDSSEDCIIFPQDSESPPKSPGPDSAAMTLVQSSRQNVTQTDLPALVDGGEPSSLATTATNDVVPPALVDDSKLSGASPIAAPGPAQPSRGDAEEVPTVPGSDGTSKPSAPLSIGDPDQSTCRPSSTEADSAHHPCARKRAHDSDDGPTVPACHGPTDAALPAKKKCKQGPEFVIDLTSEDDDPQPNDKSQGWRRMSFRLKKLVLQTDKGKQQYGWNRRSKT